MAKQRGIYKVVGRMDDSIFYRTKHGFLVRSARGIITREQIKTDPRFEATRETNGDFAYASRLGKLLRQGIKNCCPHAGDGDTYSRLNSKLIKTLQEDPGNARGNKRICAENAGLLVGFEWKEKMTTSNILIGKFAIRIDEDCVRCRTKDFHAKSNLSVETTATHAEIRLAVVRVDDEEGTMTWSLDSSGHVSLAGDTEGDLLLRCDMPEGSGSILVAGIGVSGFKFVNGKYYPLMEKNAFGVKLVKKLNGAQVYEEEEGEF